MPARPDEDLDRTDELPILDLKVLAGEAEPATTSPDPAERTDEWAILEAEARAADEIEPPMPERDELRTVLEARIAELTQALENRDETIATLQQRFADQDEQISILDAQLERQTSERAAEDEEARQREESLQSRLTEQAARLEQLESELSTARQQAQQSIESLQRQLADQRAQLARARTGQIGAEQLLLCHRERLVTLSHRGQIRESMLDSLERRLEAVLAENGELSAELSNVRAALHLVEAGAAARANTIERLTAEIEAVHPERASLAEQLAEFRERCEQQASGIERLEADLGSSRARVGELEGELETRIRDVDRLQRSNDQRDRTIEQQRTTLEQLNADLKSSRSRVGQLEADLEAQADAVARLKAETDKRDATIGQQQDRLAVLGTELEQLRSQQERGIARIAELETRLEQVQSERDSIQGRRSAADQRVAELQATLEQERQRLASAERKVEEQQAAAEAAGAVRAELESSLHATRDELKERTESLRKLEADLEAATDMVCAQRDELAKWTERVAESEKVLDDYSTTITNLEAELRASRRQRESERSSVEDLHAEIAAHGETVTALQSELISKAEHNESLRQELSSARRRYNALTEVLREREATIAALESTLRLRSVELDGFKRERDRVAADSPQESAGAKFQSVRLLVALAPGAEIKHPLFRQSTTIGRTADCDIQVAARYVSRHHARILSGANSVILEDLDSTNGVYVNGGRIDKAVLTDGDVISIGDMKFRFVDKTARANRAADAD